MAPQGAEKLLSERQHQASGKTHTSSVHQSLKVQLKGTWKSQRSTTADWQRGKSGCEDTGLGGFWPSLAVWRPGGQEFWFFVRGLRGLLGPG